ncbi:3172_t:CDS:2 [Gigaspora margarita]|uniref:3172_t:CDS:1 n=1 Tax=Gigaspora margarita TaxID=4874 RepID=A0ABN7UJJ2_GIGMA|nr:3172_t:CDS:2 [Gigaspora margarita]
MSNSIPADFALASACIGGPNKNTIYLLDRYTTKDDFSNYTIVYAFDTVTATWSTPNISGQIPISRQQFQAVDDTNGKIYMFGGTNFPNFNDIIFNDIQILDTLSLTWTQGSNVSAPKRRVDFTATILNNGIILYIGGFAVNTIYMSEIRTYNTNNNSWDCTGDTLNSRSCHTAVLSPDGHVIIYGGNIDGSTDQSQILASLDTTVNTYQWSIKPMIDTLHHPDLTISPHDTLNAGVIVVVVVPIAVLAIIIAWLKNSKFAIICY